jgi:hypothetical protein
VADAIRVLVPADTPAPISAAIVAAVRARFGTPELRVSQDETVQLDAWAAEEGGWSIRFTYTFDHDFASQYDRTESWSAVGRVDATGTFTGAWVDQEAAGGAGLRRP